jgi:hypothetical protein
VRSLTAPPSADAERGPGQADLAYAAAGTLAGYSSVALTFVLAAHEPGAFTRVLRVSFAVAGVPPIDITVSVRHWSWWWWWWWWQSEHGVAGQAAIGALPMYARSETLDFGAVFLGQTFRQELVLCNRGKSALKCTRRTAAAAVCVWDVLTPCRWRQAL